MKMKIQKCTTATDFNTFTNKNRMEKDDTHSGAHTRSEIETNYTKMLNKIKRM